MKKFKNTVFLILLAMGNYSYAASPLANGNTMVYLSKVTKVRITGVAGEGGIILDENRRVVIEGVGKVNMVDDLNNKYYSVVRPKIMLEFPFNAAGSACSSLAGIAFGSRVGIIISGKGNSDAMSFSKDQVVRPLSINFIGNGTAFHGCDLGTN